MVEQAKMLEKEIAWFSDVYVWWFSLICVLLLRFDSLHICLLLLTEFVCRFVLNPACCSKSDADYYRFIGLLFGIAIRTKKPLALHLAPLVWKLIAGIEITMDNLEEVDLAFMHIAKTETDNFNSNTTVTTIHTAK